MHYMQHESTLHNKRWMHIVTLIIMSELLIEIGVESAVCTLQDDTPPKLCPIDK